MNDAKRIVIIFHEQQRHRSVDWYLISKMAELWRDDGLEVRNVFGVDEFVPADLSILHIDLSVVPEEYLELASRYPITLNGRVRDIRKSSFSKNLLDQHNDYDGKVIVKTDLHYAGVPERGLLLSRRQRLWFRFLRGVAKRSPVGRWLYPLAIEQPTDYRIFDSLMDVPRACFDDPRTVVERFLPEQDGDDYFVLWYFFLGNRSTCFRLASKNPIVNHLTYCSMKKVEPHPDIVRLRKELGFDYGHFDYVVRGGEAILFDINTIVGTQGLKETAEVLEHLAAGIYSYFA